VSKYIKFIVHFYLNDTLLLVGVPREDM